MERLKKLRLEKGVSQQTVADYLEITRQAYSNYENGNRSADYETILKIAEYFEVSVDYLLRGGPESPASIKIPVLGSIPAGIPMEAIEDVVDWEEIPEAMRSGGKEYFGLQVKGDSMYPEYLDGDTVIVRKTPCCDSGDVCVVYVNGYDATLKRIRMNDDGSITLQPRNPEYPPRTYTREEVERLPISIAGVVVELRRKVKK